jgi:acyl-coenzyme A thioesterase PaaI-like protein
VGTRIPARGLIGTPNRGSPRALAIAFVAPTRKDGQMNSDLSPAVQDHYPDDVAHCYGCGRLNPQGLRLQTRWDGDETVALFTPRACHTAMPGFVYGGLIASLVDCHAMGTAAAAAERAAGREIGEAPAPRFVTGMLKVDYLKPTPLGPELEVRGRVQKLGERKVVVEVTVAAQGTVTARGEVVAVRLPDTMTGGASA